MSENQAQQPESVVWQVSSLFQDPVAPSWHYSMLFLTAVSHSYPRIPSVGIYTEDTEVVCSTYTKQSDFNT